MVVKSFYQNKNIIDKTKTFLFKMITIYVQSKVSGEFLSQ